MNDGFESGDSESTDDSVNTAELPELIEIENPDEHKPKENERNYTQRKEKQDMNINKMKTQPVAHR